MKSLILATLLVALMSSQVIAQENKDEINFGAIMYDGYNYISRGAFWVQRPEAKEIYNGGSPEGTETIVLQKPHFGMFAKGEHNKLDGNYIVFPIGAIIYKKNGQYFSAECGNMLIFFKPVDSVIIKKEVVTITSESKKITEGETTGNHNVTDYGKPKPNLGNLNPNKKKEKKGEIKITVGGVVVTIAIVAVIVKVATMLFHKKDGNPGGAPKTNDPPPIIPPVVIPPGGPGGAPTSP